MKTFKPCSNQTNNIDFMHVTNKSNLGSHYLTIKFVMVDYVINAVINLTAATYILLSLIYYHLKNHEKKIQKGKAILVLISLTFINAVVAFVRTLRTLLFCKTLLLLLIAPGWST